MDTRGLLVFDGDCGFCTTSARFLQRWVSGDRYAVRPWQELDLDALGLSVEDVTSAAWFVGPDGSRAGGAAAIAASLRRGRLPWRPVGAAMRLPGVRGLADRVYGWVAEHRYALPGGTPACAVPRQP